MRDTEEYWDNRVREFKSDLDRMIFSSVKFPAHDKLARDILSMPLFKNKIVVDVCCGYGRLCTLFPPQHYTGIDFSQAMIAKAIELHPDYTFYKATEDAFDMPECDIIFEAISLDMLHMTAQEFVEKHKDKARVAVVCLGSDDYIIHLK